MNGFSSAILSLLLGWLRTLFDNLWRILSSDSGGAFLSFLRLHWKTVFIVLCVGGFVLDRIIFFFRWRPDYVWSTRWGRLKRRLSRRGPLTEDAYAPLPAERPLPKTANGFRNPYAPAREAYSPPPEIYDEPENVYPLSPREAPAATGGFAPLQNALGAEDPFAFTRDFAPIAAQTPDYSYPTPPLQDVQPVFDDPTEVWTPVAPELPVEAYQQPYENPASDLVPGFGTSKPEPPVYLQETPASFVPFPTRKELYPKPEASPENEPVHPGLDLETFQQNIGLSDSREGSEEDQPLMKPLVDFPDTSYVSFYQETEPGAPARSKSGLASLAKKARELVRVSNEDNQPTIRDLQPTANIKTSFHSPVLPKKPGEGGEE